MARKAPPVSRRRPIQRRAIATVDVLLETTAQLLVAYGYERVSTNLIARRAGVSIGTLYQYFPNKDALIEELLARHLAARREILDRAATSLAQPTLADTLRSLIEARIEVQRLNPKLLQILQQHADPARFDAFDRDIERLLAAALRAHAASIRAVAPELVAQVLFRSVSGLLRTSARRDPEWVHRPEIAEEVSDLALCYLFAGNPPRRDDRADGASGPLDRDGDARGPRSRTALTSAGMDAAHAWALDFFSGYRDGFDRADPEALVAAYDIPAVFVTDSGTHVVGDRSALSGGIRGLLTSYREAGYGRALFELRAATDVSDRLRSADIVWRILDREGALLWQFNVTYVLRLLDVGYRIAVVVNPAGR